MSYENQDSSFDENSIITIGYPIKCLSIYCPLLKYSPSFRLLRYPEQPLENILLHFLGIERASTPRSGTLIGHINRQLNRWVHCQIHFVTPCMEWNVSAAWFDNSRYLISYFSTRVTIDRNHKSITFWKKYERTEISSIISFSSREKASTALNR